jgi:hypothetical protein
VTVYGCTEQAATCGKTAFVKPRPWIIGSPSRVRSWQRGMVPARIVAESRPPLPTAQAKLTRPGSQERARCKVAVDG